MRKRNRLICLLVALVIAVPAGAVPATAFAQSAGDDQYVDPFQNNDNNDNGNSGSQSDNSSAPDQTSTNGADTAGTTAAQNTATDDGSLPRTGEDDLGVIALLGVVLLGGGLALRRAWPHPE